LREALNHDNVRTVHRLDRVVSGLMVFALRSKAASGLSRQIREGEFHKEYLAVVQGCPKGGQLRHWLLRNKDERKTYAVAEGTPLAQEAQLSYQVLGQKEGLSLVRIKLLTGRTHQIRCQFAAIGCPLVGDRKYGGGEGKTALWSCKLSFRQPYSGVGLEFERMPPKEWPWDCFGECM